MARGEISAEEKKKLAILEEKTAKANEDAAKVLAEGVEFRNMQYFDKPPTSLYGPGKTSQATPPHQDAYYFISLR